MLGLVCEKMATRVVVPTVDVILEEDPGEEEEEDDEGAADDRDFFFLNFDHFPIKLGKW